MRTPYQVLVVPFRRTYGEPELLLLRRSDSGDWQFVAGGGEDAESPVETAQRELAEETCIAAAVIPLDTLSSVPVVAVCGELRWGTQYLVLREWAFAVDATGLEPTLSTEHTESQWVPAGEAASFLRWDSNVTAAWETSTRIAEGVL